jgi:hypothetical protein
MPFAYAIQQRLKLRRIPRRIKQRHTLIGHEVHPIGGNPLPFIQIVSGIDVKITNEMSDVQGRGRLGESGRGHTKCHRKKNKTSSKASHHTIPLNHETTNFQDYSTLPSLISNQMFVLVIQKRNDQQQDTQRNKHDGFGNGIQMNDIIEKQLHKRERK